MTPIQSGKTRLAASTALVKFAGLAAVLACTTAHAQSLPSGGSVAAGAATIATTAGSVTVTQTSQNAVLNWQSFSIGANEAVAFAQPNGNAVALNRVTGADPSAILGSLSSNGKVFLVNPHGIVFGQGANVNVGGLVASTLDLSDADFMNGHYAFTGAGGSVTNNGTITAEGGYVALLGGSVDNQGVIRATLGTVALAAGTAITLDVAGDGLLTVAVDQGAVGALVQNGGLIQANGGQVLMTAQAAGALLRTVVNNTGVIEARTFADRAGRIMLLGDMQSGTANIAGTLDASAPGGGSGGFIETSAATVNIVPGVRVTTLAPLSTSGTWLIDPADFVVGAGGNTTGADLSAQLTLGNVVISTIPAGGGTSAGNGDIIVNDAVSWTAATTLTMNAFGDVILNADLSATNGNIVACCGRDVVVNARLTTVRGSISLSAGRDVLVYHEITTTDGNIRLCAGHDVHIYDAMTLTRGSTIPSQSLGLPVGLTIIAGADGTGRGTLIFDPLAGPTTVTVAPANVYYNPVSYNAPTDFTPEFVLTGGATLTARMLLFANGDKTFDGTTNAVLSGFNPNAAGEQVTGVQLVAGPGASASFDTSAVGTGIGITYTGYSLTGANADRYALADNCCTLGARSRGTIAAVVVPTPTPGDTPTSTPGTPGTNLGTRPDMTSGSVTPDSSVPAQAAALAVAQRPIDGFVPIPLASPIGAGLDVADGGLRMPRLQLTSFDVPDSPIDEQTAKVLDAARSGENSLSGAASPASEAQAVPIYPRKQARH